MAAATRRRRSASCVGAPRMSSLTRAALAADLEAHAFAAPVQASLTPRRVGAETEFIPVETATWRRCPLEGDGVVAARSRSSAATAPGRAGRDAHRQGHTLLHAARRRHAHLRARRPARVQRAAVPLAERAAGPAALGGAAAPRGGGGAKASRCSPWASIPFNPIEAAPLLLRRSATSAWRTTWPPRVRPARG